MNNDWFFEKFALIADAPGAVDRMRELVLELAITGKLVPQDPKDEPAEEMLERVDADREQLVKANGIRRQEILGPIPAEDIPFAIPASWQWRYLADVCYLITDGAHHTPQYLESGVPFLSVKDVSSGRIDFSSTRYISEAAHLELCKRCQPELGDILLTKVGTTGIAVKVEDDREFSIFVSLALLKFSQPNLDGRFLTYLINSPFVRQQSADNTQGIGNKNLVLRLINRFIVPLPPLAEQKRIVAKVDELMGLCDELEVQQQERELRKSVLIRSSLSRFAESPTRENLGYLFHNSYDIPPSELRKSILTLAVQGKLVPQDPNDEPAENIVWRSETERHGSAAEGDGMQLEGKEFPWKLPLSWKWVRLGVLANIKHGYAFSSESFTSEPTQYVLTTPGNFYESGGFRDRGENTKYFKGQVPPAFIFNAGELIIPMTEQAAGLLGSPAFIPDDGKTYLHNQRIGKLEFYSDEVAPEYVFCFFNHEFFRDELARTCTGMKVRHTSPKRILKVPFALPPLLEQYRIVAKVDQLMALVDELERQQATSREKASNLLDAIVHEMTSVG
jgi:type I restriction enzyme S subunit